MLTPRFKLSQDDNHVFIVVHAPYTNISETEIDVDEENFLFVSSPYFLRLRLPGKILEDDNVKNSYDFDNGNYHLTLRKACPGEYFENLDMITSLLAPKDIPNINSDLVEALDNDGVTLSAEEPSKDNNELISNTHGYGFGNKLKTDFTTIGEEFPQIFDLNMPHLVPMMERHKLRIAQENEKFSSDHYLADLYDNELIQPYLDMKMPWLDSDYNKDADFSIDDVSILKELPNKNYLLTKHEYKQIMLGLIDILYGYCYDKRSTLNDSNVESSWTINKLASTLCWFCSFNETKELLKCCYRRALIYPIFRNFGLCQKVKDDVISLLKTGKKQVVKSLLEIHQTFNLSKDAHYILNQLYIKDYLVFIQSCRKAEIDDLAQNLLNTEIAKEDLDLELGELEYAANLVQDDEANVVVNDMAVRMARMNLLASHARAQESYLDDSDDTSDFESDSSSDDSSSDSDTDSSSDDSSDDSTSDTDSEDIENREP